MDAELVCGLLLVMRISERDILKAIKQTRLRRGVSRLQFSGGN